MGNTARRASNSLAALAGGFLKGYISGQEKRGRKEKEDLDRMLKIMDYNSKAANLKKAELEALDLEDRLKAAGILDYSQRDDANAREVGAANLGDGKRRSYPNTARGRAARMFDEGNPEDYDMTVTMGKGTEYRFSPKKGSSERRTPGQSDIHNKNVFDIASKMAQREYLERLTAEGRYDPNLHDPNKFPVPTELVDAYTPYAEAFLSGDYSGAKKVSEQRRAGLTPLRMPTPKKAGFMDTLRSAFGDIGGGQ